ncbi:hypothetical protein [Brevundimonas sp. NIBR11]|uniref:hypothetical protein n=1 Tax=Brevundimonas sp. NIBR11 TaxID=3015999 RepID=UPI0022F00532|nr:hypothetical protein [Brevundimonas sp. NIBR11]WGM31083.1 hypothetical protein KKHFBJBL_01322 [Brevundimonas sp. NIBR11]
MIIAALAVALMAQTAPAAEPSEAEQQAAAQQVLDGMRQIYTVLGSCERHFTPEQVAGIRRTLEPDAGAVGRTPLQQLLDDAYQTGKADTSKSAPFCQRAMQMIAESQAARN